MGNTCCQTDVTLTSFDRVATKLEDYRVVDWPDDDQTLQEWRSKVGTYVSQLGTGSEESKLMKHKGDNKYFMGSWRNDLAEGDCLVYEPERLLFDGPFVNGFPEGDVKIDFLYLKSDYKGKMKKGKAEGIGTYCDMNNRVTFSGEWQDSRPKQGTLTIDNDTNISFVEFEDFLEGKGVIHYKDQRKYEGDIYTKKILPHGTGTVTYPFQSKKVKYSGGWDMGEMSGNGRQEWTDSSVYEGGYLKGKKSGFGKYVFSNGTYHEGYWSNGKQEGTGEFRSKNDELLKKGVWENGQFVKAMQDDEWLKLRAVEEQMLQQKMKNSEKEAQQVNFYNDKEESQGEKLEELPQKSSYSDNY